MQQFIISALLASNGYVPELPKGAVEYKGETHTQALSQTSYTGVGGPYFRKTLPVAIASLPEKDWHQSGGMHGIKGVESRKFRLGEQKTRYAFITMTNGHKHADGTDVTQQELGIVRVYPDGARFDDVLYYKGKVFEHRVREKAEGQWYSSTIYRNPSGYPPGYTGLKQTCASCHNKAGTGGYAAGLVPGGDTVFSDPLDWSVVPPSARR